MIDATMRSLAAPQACHVVGRPDIEGAERPGAALLALVLDAVRSGRLDRPSPGAERPVPAFRGHAAAPALDLGRYDAFEEACDGDEELTF